MIYILDSKTHCNITEARKKMYAYWQKKIRPLRSGLNWRVTWMKPKAEWQHRDGVLLAEFLRRLQVQVHSLHLVQPLPHVTKGHVSYALLRVLLCDHFPCGIWHWFLRLLNLWSCLALGNRSLHPRKPWLPQICWKKMLRFSFFQNKKI